jgi:hypothetical protein
MLYYSHQRNTSRHYINTIEVNDYDKRTANRHNALFCNGLFTFPISLFQSKRASHIPKPIISHYILALYD